jgi:soluble lytic murein transglycosylase-like protein
MTPPETYPLSGAAKDLKRKLIELNTQKRMNEGAALIKSAGLSATDSAILQGIVAQGYLYGGQTAPAYDIAAQAARTGGINAPDAAWIAGLASWKRQAYKQAASYFEIVAYSPYASPWSQAAGAYWASRAYRARGRMAQSNKLLDKAAENPRTFYGLIAARARRNDMDFNWNLPRFGEKEFSTLKSSTRALRAMALAEAGQPHLAQAELLRLKPANAAMQRAVLAYAAQMKLPAVTMRLGNRMTDSNGKALDAAFYPRGDWSPTGGYTIDPALVNAIIRQESMFDNQAESPSGAKGLMQLMPATADFIANNMHVNLGSNRQALFNPAVNLAIGQSYIAHLLQQTGIDGDIISLLVAYNGGEGNLRKWKNQWNDVDDPLLFIELIPHAETRAYVERVLSSYWIYRLRERQDTPLLNALATDKAPHYADRREQILFKIAGL